jgi:hypothetical protein
MATDGHGIFRLNLRKKTVSIRVHPCQNKKKKYEGNAEIGIGT